MPLYTYQCRGGHTVDAYRSILERDNCPNCPQCKHVMKKIIVPPAIGRILGVASNPGYKCPVTGEFVTSSRRRKEIMQEHNLVEKDWK